jgi:hypothetical protein
MKGTETSDHIVREAIELGEIRLEHIRSQDNIADIMTKPLPEASHTKHTNSLLKEKSK